MTGIIEKTSRILGIDTSETIAKKWSKRHAVVLVREREREARGTAERWARRATAHAEVGEFVESDECMAECFALHALADRLYEFRGFAR